MKYDDLFEKPITEYSEEEITARAMQLRLASKVTKQLTNSVTADTKPKPTTKRPKQSKAEQMLEAAMAKAKLLAAQGGQVSENSESAK
jgi:hypothetical protein